MPILKPIAPGTRQSRGWWNTLLAAPVNRAFARLRAPGSVGAYRVIGSADGASVPDVSRRPDWMAAAIITARQGPASGPADAITYDADALSRPGLALRGVEPMYGRPGLTLERAAEVGDACAILRFPDPEPPDPANPYTYGLLVWTERGAGAGGLLLPGVIIAATHTQPARSNLVAYTAELGDEPGVSGVTVVGRPYFAGWSDSPNAPLVMPAAVGTRCGLLYTGPALDVLTIGVTTERLHFGVCG